MVLVMSVWEMSVPAEATTGEETKAAFTLLLKFSVVGCSAELLLGITGLDFENNYDPVSHIFFFKEYIHKNHIFLLFLSFIVLKTKAAH